MKRTGTADRGDWRNTPRLPFLPFAGIYVVTCIDPRTDPAEFLGLRFAGAVVERTVGGRVTDDVMRDLSYIGYLVEQKAPEGPGPKRVLRKAIYHSLASPAASGGPT